MTFTGDRFLRNATSDCSKGLEMPEEEAEAAQAVLAMMEGKSPAEMDVEKLQRFSEELGVVSERENHLIFNLLKENFIDKPSAITFEQFYLIMKTIMNEDKDLTLEVLQ